jgi:tRNA threonylcarbamoyladenosine biosynthesis protein TsaE
MDPHFRGDRLWIPAQGRNDRNVDFLTTNAGETQQLAGKIIKDLAGRPTRGALVLALEGELGAGKTAFTQGLGEALGIKEKILSPTFVIMKRFTIYDLRFKNFKNLYHLDAYRLSGAGDTKELGLEEILKDKNNLVVIEWAERIKDILPPDTVWLKFEHGGEDRRKIEVM